MTPLTLLRALFKRPQRPLPNVAPEIATEYRLDQLPLESIARYRAAFGFAGGHIPLTWWYLPAQRAHLATMLDPRFPFRIAGLVHMENVLEEHGQALPGEELMLRTVLRMQPPSAGGALCCVLETAGSAEGRPVFTCTSTYLVRRGQGGARRPETSFDLPGPALAQWTLDAAAGRRYARLSGDWNPIHLYRWSARLMGLPRPIIHGMHTLARVCAALENKDGRRLDRLDCRFSKAVPLGQTLSLFRDEHAAQFTVVVDDRPAVTGHCGS